MAVNRTRDARLTTSAPPLPSDGVSRPTYTSSSVTSWGEQGQPPQDVTEGEHSGGDREGQGPVGDEPVGEQPEGSPVGDPAERREGRARDDRRGTERLERRGRNGEPSEPPGGRCPGEHARR